MWLLEMSELVVVVSNEGIVDVVILFFIEWLVSG